MVSTDDTLIRLLVERVDDLTWRVETLSIVVGVGLAALVFAVLWMAARVRDCEERLAATVQREARDVAVRLDLLSAEVSRLDSDVPAPPPAQRH